MGAHGGRACSGLEVVVASLEPWWRCKRRESESRLEVGRRRRPRLTGRARVRSRCCVRAHERPFSRPQPIRGSREKRGLICSSSRRRPSASLSALSVPLSHSSHVEPVRRPKPSVPRLCASHPRPFSSSPRSSPSSCPSLPSPLSRPSRTRSQTPRSRPASSRARPTTTSCLEARPNSPKPHMEARTSRPVSRSFSVGSVNSPCVPLVLAFPARYSPS